MKGDVMANDDVRIDRDIPIPDRHSYADVIRVLEVGDSARFPLDDRNNVAVLASRFKRESDGELSFTVRKVDNKYARIWRTK